MVLTNPTFARDTLITPIIIMVENGVTFRTFIDVGAADGTFGLTVLDGVNAGLQVLNVEAQAAYEPSLRQIEALLGAPYRITAVAEHEGTIRVARPAHEYWLSTAAHMGARREGEPAPADALSLPCRRLDRLVAEIDLPRPFFIKLDVEGAELDVLRGADGILADTCGLLIECPVRATGGPQFIDIYALLAARGFSLFDIVRLSHRGSDATLYQFYAVFIAGAVDFRARNPLRSAAQQAEITTAVRERREALRAENTSLIAAIKLKRAMGATASPPA